MSTILFVGPYMQSDGWGNAAKEYIRALRLTKHNLTVRPVYLNMQGSYDKFDEFEDLENNVYDRYDIVIQNCLPHQFRRYGGVKNIGLSFFESSIESTPWPLSINLMDEMWVSSAFEQEILADSHINVPIKVVHMPTDITKYDKQYPRFDFHNNHEFKFYFIGEFVTRKNLDALIIAFHREFHKDEMARLVLKTNVVGLDDISTLSYVNNHIRKLKESMSIYPKKDQYKSEIIITKFLSIEELYGLHLACDCFVMPSSGEAICIPAFDAIGFGKTPIVNTNTSMGDYVDANGFLVNSYECPAIDHNRPLPFLYTGKDTWYNIDILSLQSHMRKAFEMSDDVRARMHNNAKAMLSRYSYEAVAKIMEKHL